MKGEYKYNCRLGFGSDKLLIEFTNGAERKTFGVDLLDALKDINPKVTRQTDLWMNDEFIYDLNSDEGHFELSLDNWGLAFIMSDDNQSCIHTIDKILAQDERFEKIKRAN
jgi:hypothetical protein